MERLHAARDRYFGNARTARNLFDDVVAHQAERLLNSGVKPDRAALMELTPADVQAATRARLSDQIAGTSGLDGLTAIPRSPASSSSITAVSAIATPVRWSSRAAKSASIAAIAAEYRVRVVRREGAQRGRGALERLPARLHPGRALRDLVVVAEHDSGDREHVRRDRRAFGVRVAVSSARTSVAAAVA